MLSTQPTQERSGKHHGKNSKHNYEDDSILLANWKVREQQKVLTTEDNWDMIRSILYSTSFLK